MKYPNKALTAEILAEVARRVAASSSTEHPVDVAAAMSFAVEYAGETLAVLVEKELL